MVYPDDTGEIKPEEKEFLKREFDKIVGNAQREWAANRQQGKLPPGPPKIVYCMNFYEERMPQVKACIIRVRPYVDRCVLVFDDTVSLESQKWLRQWGCELHYRKWDNHFSKQRNAYLDHVNEGEWVLTSDPDELYSESFMEDLQKILIEADKTGTNTLRINAVDLTLMPGDKVTRVVSDWFKQLIFKFEEGVRYVGCVHETLLPGIHGWRVRDLDKRYFYEHTKSYVEVKERGARNVFCGGGGNNVRDKNPMYVELQRIAKRLGLEKWPQMREYIRRGNIDPELQDIIVKNRNDAGWDWENESRDFFLWCKAIHPRQFKEWESKPKSPSKGSPTEVMAYVEDQYLKILGRNADDVGKQHYTMAIVQGRIKREDLPKILKESEEYKQKHGDTK